MHKLACCRRDREMSMDFEEHERIMSCESVESCTYDNYSCEKESCGTLGELYCSDSAEDDAAVSPSSSKEKSEPSSSPCRPREGARKQGNESEFILSTRDLSSGEKSTYTMKVDDIDAMKERFSKLLLGEDMSGGCRGLSSALALSNAITNLAGSVFGELWRLEPLSEGRRRRWSREMDWLLSPANYMIELVPAKQLVPDGKCLEIMTPRVRSDIQMNLPALTKLDAMLIKKFLQIVTLPCSYPQSQGFIPYKIMQAISFCAPSIKAREVTDTISGMLDSMVDTEFWYAEGGSRAEGRSRAQRQSKKWWLPVPRVPSAGISAEARKKLVLQSEAIHQVLKAVKSINEQVVSEMLIPQPIFDTFPKTIKACLGESLYKILAANSGPSREIIQSINLTSESEALNIASRLQMAILTGKQRLPGCVAGKAVVRNSWSFTKDCEHEVEKTECCLQQIEAVLLQLKLGFPNLPQTAVDITRVRFNKDIGYSILEAYSRVLGNLAYTILLRIMEVLQEDEMTKNHLEKRHTPVTDFGSNRCIEKHNQFSDASEGIPQDMLSNQPSDSAQNDNENDS